MNVRYSRRASADLLSIFEFLDQHSPAGASHVMTAIYAAVEFIRRNPQAAEMTSLRDIRAKTVPRYRFRVFYRVVDDHGAIEIVHVRHTSRRPWSGGSE